MDFENEPRSQSIQVVDLSIGDCIRIGNQVLTVVDVDGQDVCFRVDAANQLISIARADRSAIAPRSSTPR
jgi:YD repeat-containing protein